MSYSLRVAVFCTYLFSHIFIRYIFLHLAFYILFCFFTNILLKISFLFKAAKEDETELETSVCITSHIFFIFFMQEVSGLNVTMNCKLQNFRKLQKLKTALFTACTA